MFPCSGDEDIANAMSPLLKNKNSHSLLDCHNYKRTTEILRNGKTHNLLPSTESNHRSMYTSM